MYVRSFGKLNIFRFHQINLININVYIITWKKEANQLKDSVCILHVLSENFIFSVYFIQKFLKGFTKKSWIKNLSPIP